MTLQYLAACLLLRPVPVADTEVEAEAEPVPAEAEAGSAEAEDGAAAGLKQARLEPTTNTWGHSSYCSHGCYYLHLHTKIGH